MEGCSITLLSASSRGSNSPVICGVDDGGFTSRENTVLVASAWMLSDTIIKIRFGKIARDGIDATKVLKKILGHQPAQAYLLHGITFGGFNVVDAFELQKYLSRPVIVVSGSKPRPYLIRTTLQKHFPDWKGRWRLIEALPHPISIVTKTGEQPVYIEGVGLPRRRAQSMVQKLCVASRIPEPLRVASIIAKGLSRHSSTKLTTFGSNVDRSRTTSFPGVGTRPIRF